MIIVDWCGLFLQRACWEGTAGGKKGRNRDKRKLERSLFGKIAFVKWLDELSFSIGWKDKQTMHPQILTTLY